MRSIGHWLRTVAPLIYKAMTHFRKMHGLGNDFVVFDARKQGIALSDAAARRIADRRFGIGCDQVIVIEPGHGKFDAVMKIQNADGGEVESCGNAVRCVARLLMEETRRETVRIDTMGGALICSDAGGGLVTVDMGAPKTMWHEVPLAHAADTNMFQLNVDGTNHVASALSVGNPHLVLFVEDAERAPVETLGPKIERHPMFPERTNVEFVSFRGPDRLRMRVWERGVGITMACGTGACATAVASFRRALSGRRVEVVLDGGPLAIELRERDDHILMTGPGSEVFCGDIDLAAVVR